MVLSAESTIFVRVVVLTCVFGRAPAYPDGAGDAACADMVPQHGCNEQNSSSPYAVLLSSPTYKPNSTLQVTIVSVGQPSFEGFLIQARLAYDPDVTTPVGSFQATQNTHAMCIDATTGGAALTHSDSSLKTNLTLTWNAPATAQGSLVFIVTVVQAQSTFWAHRVLANVSGMAPIIPITSTKTPTTTGVPTPSSISTATCGKDKSCIYSPSTCSDASCDFILTWKLISAAAAATAVRFELQAKSIGYVAVGFSKSTEMNQDSIVACVRTDTSATVRQLFSTKKDTPQPVDSPTNLMNVSVQVSTSTVSCTFLWNNDASARASKQQFNLSDSYYVILAKGPAKGDSSGGILQHDTVPLVSDSMLVMTTDKYTVNGASVDRISWLVKIHGALMVVAWMLCGGTSVILARYYKKMWLDRKHCGEKVWFAWHRAGFIVTLILVAAAVIVIFVHVGGWSASRGLLPLDAHPFIGIVATGFCVINPVMAAFRCSPGSKSRYLFNWAHWFVGTTALILAGAAILIGLQFDGVAPPWLLYAAAAYVAFYTFAYFALWLHDLVDARTGEMQLLIRESFPINEERGYGCSFKCAAFVVYLLVTVGMTGTIVYFIFSNSDSSSPS